MSRDLTRRGAMGAATAAAIGSTLTGIPAVAADVAGVEKAYAEGPYGQIHYRIARPSKSNRTPLLCLHASPLSGVIYEYWLAEMGKDRLTLAPDTPGYGGSDAPPAPPQIGDYAAAFVRFMDEMKLRTVDVMGYHTGSMISAEMARRYPDRIRRVVMVSAPIFTPEELAKLKASAAGPEPTYEQMLDRALQQWRTQGRGMFRDVPSDDRYVDISLERMRRFRTGPWGFRAAFNYDLTKALPEIAQPVLILNPEDDVWLQTPRAKPFLRNGRIHDLPGWTHGFIDSHTAETAAVVRPFLDS